MSVGSLGQGTLTQTVLLAPKWPEPLQVADLLQNSSLASSEPPQVVDLLQNSLSVFSEPLKVADLLHNSSSASSKPPQVANLLQNSTPVSSKFPQGVDLRWDTSSTPSEPLMNAQTTVVHVGCAMNFETSGPLLLMPTRV